MSWIKNNLANILAPVIIIGIFAGAYLLGRYLTEGIADILQIAAVSVVVIFVLFCIISPFIKR